ncbi:hypothetical protein Taro_035918 [Colocasia esculenta]|uniref:Leucine-rich repeat-containing N-terminal plant-type domain-containing protein n=1 Tax=Colocasia esculenta TaxID=4460 RepID=A0A843WBV4_COLES|nr:hypothetical protein [Colocasia esculenta]
MLGSGRGTALRRVALPLQHGVFTAGACWGAEGDRPGLKEGGKCIERERKSLLAVRADIWYPRNHWPFSSWEKINGDDCCLWEGVRCDNQSGHVIKLDLRRPQPSYYDDDYYYDEVSPSLLNLTWLRYLDLSNNYFRGGPIPNFIGSLVNLEYLNLSHAGFGGTLPPQLGGLHLLHSLDLSGNYMLKVENLHWLSHLQYLDMSWVDLSAATDWLHVINGLPSLSVVRLSDCRLQTLPTTLPHVNFTSLSTLDLSWNFFFNTKWPLWLFNITTLAELDLISYTFGLRYNFGLRGPIPDEFEKMKHLEVLKLTGGFGIDGGVTPPSSLTLNKLKELDLSGIRLPEHMEKLSNLRTLALRDIIGQIPESLGNLSHLESLFIYGGGNTSTELPDSLRNLMNLKRLDLRLDLSIYDFQGSLPESLGNLSRLESLSIRGYIHSTTGLPESLGNLGNLKTLELSLYNFHGAIPESLGNLSRLESLSISSGYIITVPESLGNLVNLKDLRLYSYDIISRGGIPKSLGNLRGLKTLHVSGFNVSPQLLRNIGHLCNLTLLEMAGNIGRGAEVNELFEGLSQCTEGSSLEHLVLRDNGFGGYLPNQVGQLSNLNSLVLAGNSFVGSIPASIGEQKSLTNLILRDNNLTGLVPSSIGKLSNLMNLVISSNRFDGVLSEAHFANLSKLKNFAMSYNPALSLSIHWAWLPPFQLDTFKARLCKIGPKFPKWLQTQKKLWELDISNNTISDTLGSNFFNSFGRMPFLNLSHNGIKCNDPRIRYPEPSKYPTLGPPPTDPKTRKG